MVFPSLPQRRQALPPRTSEFVPVTKLTKKQLCKDHICQQCTMAVAAPRIALCNRYANPLNARALTGGCPV